MGSTEPYNLHRIRDLCGGYKDKLWTKRVVVL